MNSLLIPSVFAASRLHPDSLLWSMTLHLYPSLYIGWSVFLVLIGVLLGDGSLSASTLYPSARRAFISSQVVA